MVIASVFSLAPENLPDECEVDGIKTDLEKLQSRSKEKRKGRGKKRLRVGDLLSRRSLTEAFLNIERLTDDTDDLFDINDLSISDPNYEESVLLSESLNSMQPVDYPTNGQDTKELLTEPRHQVINPDLENISSGCDSWYSDSPFSFTQNPEVNPEYLIRKSAN